MKLTEKDILYVARLARLDLSDQDVETFTRQLGDVLSYMDKLGEVDTAGVPGTSHATPMTNAFREDEAKPSMDPDEILKNAPQREDNDILVPKVI